MLGYICLSLFAPQFDAGGPISFFELVVQGKFFFVDFFAAFEDPFYLSGDSLFFFFELAGIKHWLWSICPLYDLIEWDSYKASREEEQVDERAPECDSANRVGRKSQSCFYF